MTCEDRVGSNAFCVCVCVCVKVDVWKNGPFALESFMVLTFIT